jgi:hypothetical protein
MLNTILARFRKFFPASSVNALAKQSGLVTRSTSRLSGAAFFSLILEVANSPAEVSLRGFCRLLAERNKGVQMRVQSLWERIVSEKTVTFMKRMYEKTMSIPIENAKNRCPKISCSFFEKFTQILIEDSTVISLNEKLFPHFQGCGGSASRSSLKIHLIFDAISSKIKALNVITDKRPDQALANVSPSLLDRKSLLIRDLGFFSTLCIKKICEIGAYFISRLHIQANVHINKDDKEPVDLIDYIRYKHKHQMHGSIDVFLGESERQPVRLIFYRTPEAIVNIRKRNVWNNAKKKGRTPSQQILKWQEYTLFITNLPEEMASTEMIGTIYRLRWDIELIFKTWKSHLRLDVLIGTRKERIEVLLYAKMIGILLLGIVHEYLQILCLEMFPGCEVSMPKVAELLTTTGLFSSLFKGYLGTKAKFLSDKYWVHELCSQKRKRKKTRGKIQALEPFGERFMA